MPFADDFFTRALIAGIGVACIAGPLGCFVVWQRLSYLGDAMAHSALLGIALSLAFDIHLMIGVFASCLLVASVLARVRGRSNLSGDSALGIMSHSTLAIGLVILSLMYWVRVDILHFLFGNILAVTWVEIFVIYAGGIVIMAVLWWKWHALISLAVDKQIAAVEGSNPQQTQYLMMILLATIVAFSMKIVGIVLTVSLLIIPASASRQFAKTPEQMAVIASIFGVIAVVGGLNGSLEFDTPPGPSIVISAFIIFLLAMSAFQITARLARRTANAKSKK